MAGSVARPLSSPLIHPKLRHWLQNLSFWLFVLTLAWAPFPLGSNRPWAWSLLCLLIVVCWLLWCGALVSAASIQPLLLRLAWPLGLGAAALLWGLVQAAPFAPAPLAHWAWRYADQLLGTTGGAISLAPWRTLTEVMKLASYGLAFVLVTLFCARSERAQLLFNAVIVICGCYAAYSLVLAALAIPQLELFYAGRGHSHLVAAPFVNRNSFATYAAMGALCSGARLVERGRALVVTWRGPRTYLRTLLPFLFGRGALWLVCSLLCVAALLGTASRAGNGAFLVGAVVAAYMALSLKAGQRGTRRALWLGMALVASFCALVLVDGGRLAARLNDMNMVSLRDDARLQLWTAALHMIADRPLRGLGLGSFVVAYPAYDVHTMPFIMDRAHNDYLELAAGFGLPAAVAWWSALGWLIWRCVRGAYERRRHRLFPLAAVAVATAVGFHALFDFSLQMPAIALTFATILGIGVAQAFPTRRA